MDEALAAARLAVELEDGLCLLFVVGPADRAREGLEFVRARLPAGPTTWHRLDRDGLDLEASMRKAGKHATTLVHGLERLCDDDRLWAASLLNLHRDKLERAQGTLVLWVPDDHLRIFVKRAPDLYAWRSMVLQVTAADVPIPNTLAWRRRFLLATLRSLDFIEPPTWWVLSDLGRMTNRGYFVEPAVTGPDGQEMTLSAWAAERKLGLLTGPPGSGRRTALFWLAWQAAARALEDLEAPLPLVLWEQSRSIPRGSRPESAHAWLDGLVSRTAQSLGLPDSSGAGSSSYVLFVDRRGTFPSWPRSSDVSLEDLRWSQPVLGIVAVFATGEANEGSAGWASGALRPWDQGRVQEWSKRVAEARVPERQTLRGAALQTMLTSMFACYELRKDLVGLDIDDRGEILAETPHDCFKDVATRELVRIFVRHELVGTTTFETFVQLRPRREREIRALEAVWVDPASTAPVGARLRGFADPSPREAPIDASRMSSRPLLLSEGAGRLDDPANRTPEELEALLGRIRKRRPYRWISLHDMVQLELERFALALQGAGETRVGCAPDGSGDWWLAGATLSRHELNSLVAQFVFEFEGPFLRFSFPLVQRWYAARALARLARERQRELGAGREEDPEWAELLRLMPRKPDPPDKREEADSGG